MMQTYSITATLVDPVALRRSRQSQASDSLMSISGSTLRGALAQSYLDEHGCPDATFADLFLNELRMRFGPLNPWQQRLPLTATSCKRSPGASDSGGHGIVDQLWLRIAEQLAGGPLPAQRTASWMKCQCLVGGAACDAVMRPCSGGYSPTQDPRPHAPRSAMPRSSPATSVNAHVGIDPSTRTASPSIFYSLTAIDAVTDPGSPQRWHGTVQADPDALQLLQTLLESVEHTVRLGHAKTRGYGRVRLAIGEAAAMTGNDHDYEAWSRDLHKFLQAMVPAAQAADPASHWFAITFPAGAILVDRFLRYSLDPADLVPWLPAMRAPGVRDARIDSQPLPDHREFGTTLESVLAVTRHETIRGWNAAHGLPRADDAAIAPGAVYVYQYRGTSPSDIWTRLDRLVADGVGLRRNEGFGTVMASDPFHKNFSSPRRNA